MMKWLNGNSKKKSRLNFLWSCDDNNKNCGGVSNIIYIYIYKHTHM